MRNSGLGLAGHSPRMTSWGTANWGIHEVAVGGSVDLNDERWEEDVHSQALHPDKATSMLTLMGAETEEGIVKGEDMEAIPNQDAFAIDGNDSRAGAKDGGK